MKQFKHIMAGRGHALMVEGRLDSSELAQYSRDSQSSLASDLASCFATSDVAQSWTALAAKDLEDVEMVEEGKFKQVIDERMKALAEETLRLCGVTDLAAYRMEKERREHEVISDYLLDDMISKVDPAAEPATSSNLFDFDFSSNGIEEAFPGAKLDAEQKEVHYEPTLVVDINKYRGRRKKMPSENQLCWNI
jgi:hypothetical protein